MQEVIYKGATRPPMKWGVPLTGLVLLLVPATLLAVWSAFGLHWLIGRQGLLVLLPSALAVAACHAWMRWATARDDQRMAQMLLAARLNRANRARGLFGLRSYSPYRARGASDVWRG